MPPYAADRFARRIQAEAHGRSRLTACRYLMALLLLAFLASILTSSVMAASGHYTASQHAIGPKVPLGKSRAARSRVSHAHAAVIGGKPAQDGTFASVAYIIDIRGNTGGKCTGTVVAPLLVLTAAHCAENMKTGVLNKPSGYRVVTGSVAMTSAEPQVLMVSSVLVYEGFVRGVDDRDAALLVLSTPTTAPAITLASTSDLGLLQKGSEAMIAGWGRTHYQQSHPTERLQWADTALQAGQWCKRNAPPFYARSEICTITPPSYATGACEGDSGGPLLAQAPGRGEPIQIGITAHGYGRCSTHLPSVYTRVDLISSWVHTWIAAYKLPPTPPPTPPASPTPPVPPAPPAP
jgi:secreted trypsin-like serine protease